MDQTIQIKCFESCVYDLTPKFFECAAVPKCAKIFKYLFMFCDYRGNDRAIEALEKLLPELCEKAKTEWHDRSIEYQNGYQSTDRAALPSNLFYKKQIDEEIASRKRSNDKLMKAVKSAKSKYDHAVKVWNSYTAAKEKYK